MTAEFSPELKLLLSLLRAALGTQEAGNGAKTDDVDWPTFVRTTQRHRVGSFLYHRAPARLAATCPPPVVAQFRAIAENSAGRALAQAAELVRLTRLLAAAGIESLPVKGVVLSEQLYGALGLRHAGDIDLLVHPHNAVAADATFRSAGLRRTIPRFALTPRQTSEYLRLKSDFEYERDPSQPRVELLWRLEGLPESDAVWTRAVPCVFGGESLRTLAPDLNARYVFQHGARHAWFRLFWLVDAALFLREPQLDWPAIVARARELGVERGLLQGAALAHSLLAITPPAGLLPSARERRLVSALSRESHRQMLRRPVADEPMIEWLRQLCYRVRLQRGWRAKFAVLSPHLFSPLSWQTLPLPDRWYFLYHFATPLLWLWRRLGPQRAPDRHGQTGANQR